MIDGVTLEMWDAIIENAAAWIAFYFALLGLVAAIILAALFGGLAVGLLGRWLMTSTWKRVVVRIERKALRQ